MKKTIIALLFLTLTFSLKASDSDTAIELESTGKLPVFIELYTSQGCSSCPPADTYLNSLKNKKGLFKDFIPMAFHVDYWDYLGWSDPFASVENSNRQRIYRATEQSKSVYTPQFIVDSEEWRGFFKRKPVRLKSDKRIKNTLSVAATKQTINAHFSSIAPLKEPRLNVAILGIGTETQVPSGENAGKTLKQDFVVLSHEIHKPRDNSLKSKWLIDLSKPDATVEQYALVAWVTDGLNLSPQQAVASYIPKSLFGED